LNGNGYSPPHFCEADEQDCVRLLDEREIREELELAGVV
jgi:hypothetical protein